MEGSARFSDALAHGHVVGAGKLLCTVPGTLLLLVRQGSSGLVKDGLLELAVESLDTGLEGCNFVAEGDEDVGERVVDFAGVGDEDALALLVDDVGGDADDGGVWGDVAEDDGASADAGALADDDVAEDVGVVADEDAVAEGGVAFAAGFAGAAEGDGLVEGDVVADDGGFADDDADAVVDEEAAADAGGGMDLDAGPEAGPLGEDAGEESEVVAPEPVLDAMGPDGVEAGVAENYHEPRGGGGIAIEDGLDVFADRGEEIHGGFDDSAWGWGSGLRQSGTPPMPQRARHGWGTRA
jgi:hypothetical protein